MSRLEEVGKSQTGSSSVGNQSGVGGQRAGGGQHCEPNNANYTLEVKLEKIPVSLMNKSLCNIFPLQGKCSWPLMLPSFHWLQTRFFSVLELRKIMLENLPGNISSLMSHAWNFQFLLAPFLWTPNNLNQKFGPHLRNVSLLLRH